MSITRLLILSGLVGLAACSSPTEPGSDLATGTLKHPGTPLGHPVPINRPCQEVSCQITQ